LIPDYRVMLAIVLVHGVFWSGLLSASAAYMANMLPEHRRAEGIGYWGLSTVAAIAVAPPVGFWLYQFGWVWLCAAATALNLMMTAIAWTLEDTHVPVPRTQPRRGGLLEWRILVVSGSLFLYSFGYGGVTSFTALYADANGVAPKGIYLTTLALVILVTRRLSGRLGDRLGYKRVFVPCLAVITLGLACLAVGGTRPWLILSAVVFGTGFGAAYPAYVGYVLQGVASDRRGAAFGAVLAAFDTGIGTGSTSIGWLIQRYGYANAFAVAAALSALALPYFLVVDRLVNRHDLPDV
jgi:predicted MFS family arabinose efflux permease